VRGIRVEVYYLFPNEISIRKNSNCHIRRITFFKIKGVHRVYYLFLPTPFSNIRKGRPAKEREK